jgi:hypothetical protein
VSLLLYEGEGGGELMRCVVDLRLLRSKLLTRLFSTCEQTVLHTCSR